MRSDLLRLADALWAELEGQPLGDWLVTQREKKVSLRETARYLYDKTGGALDVTPQTVANWTAEYDAEHKAAA